jgi:hypothetical protein
VAGGRNAKFLPALKPPSFSVSFMKILILNIVMLTSLVVNSQIRDSAYLNFINGQLRRLQPNGIIYYSDKISKRQIEPIIKMAPLQLLQLKNKGLVFTSSEKAYIIANLKRIPVSTRADSLFPDSKRLGADTLVRFVERNFRKKIDSLLHSPDSLFVRKNYIHMRPWAFFFSEPVYLRNRTILIYYFVYYFNSSGEEAVWVCRKNNSTWDKIGIIGGGAW